MTDRELLSQQSRHDSFWSTTNLAEAIPGVSTPLNWTLWGPTIEGNTRRIFRILGVLSAEDTAIPADRKQWAYGVFYGRPAFRVDFFCDMGDRLPGTNGRAVAHQLMSHVPPDFQSHPLRRYYPVAALRMPIAFVRAIRLSRTGRYGTDRWWRESLRVVPTADEVATRAAFAQAVQQFRDSLFRHGLAFFVAVQPAYDFLNRLAAGTPVDAGELMKGYGGHEEVAIIEDLWACSRGRMNIDSFLDKHGYHGAGEGQISATVWREDPSTVAELIKRYQSMPDDADPSSAASDRMRQRQLLEKQFLSTLPARRRILGRAVLRLARLCIPLRGVNKVGFVQSLDIARITAKRLGLLMAADGRLRQAEDIFFLTVDEILAGGPDSDSAELIRERRAAYDRYHDLALPSSWRGMPAPVPVRPGAVDEVVGIGVSPGTVEGIARVVLNPSDVAGEPGEVLIAHTTDPSWASVMFLSAALVTDIGGPLSHAAIVARELGIPCVVDTQDSTTVINSGDRVSVNGTTGKVTIKSRCTSNATAE